MSLSRREFRRVVQNVCDDDSNIDRQTAYQVISVCGKTVLQSHLASIWPVESFEINGKKLYDIYRRLEDLEITDGELLKISKAKLTVEQILAAVPEEGVIDKERVEECLRTFEQNGFVAVEKFVRAAQLTRDETQNKFLEKEGLIVLEVMKLTFFLEGDTSAESSSPENSIDDELNNFVNRDHINLSVRGFLAISPSLLAVKFVVDSDEELVPCEFLLSLANNSDVPPGQFDNDLFLLVYHEQTVVGISQYVLKDKHYSTGEIKVKSGDELMVIGMGTSYSRRKTTRDREPLITADGKITKRFQMTLMNIFDSFDVDANRLLDRKEHDFYTIATGDSPLNDEEWQMLTSQFDSRDDCITLEGFLKMHQLEATAKDQHVLDDMWASLNRLGYDNSLQCIYGCSYNIDVYANHEIRLDAELHFISREDRSFILQKLYELGAEEDSCALKPRVFRTEYFGLMIAKKKQELLGRRYRLEIIEDRNVRWNFVSGRDLIHLEDSDSEWVLIVSYTVNEEDYVANFHLLEI